MAFSSNINSGGPPNGGMFVEGGTERRQVCIDIKDMIVGDSESRWKEVTSSSPTPASIQQYASTINPSNVNNNNEGFGEHVTLYLADDSALSFSNPGARLIRICNLDSGIGVCVLDSYFVNSPNDQSFWTWLSEDSFSNPSNWYNPRQYTFTNDNNSNGYNDANGSSLKQDYKFFYALNDQFLWMNAYLPKKVDDFGLRGGAIYYPYEPSNGTINREDRPFIWTMEGFANHKGNGSNNLHKPAGGGSGRQTYGDLSPFVNASRTDAQGRYIFSPVWAHNDTDSGIGWHMDSVIPNIRRIDSASAFKVGDHSFPTKTIGGTEYFLAGGQEDNGDHYLVQVQ